MRIDAAVGDEIVVDFTFMGQPPRKGEVLEILGGPGHEHYRVRWDEDGHESVFFPGPTTHVVALGRPRA
jgi:hypothetical protein